MTNETQGADSAERTEGVPDSVRTAMEAAVTASAVSTVQRLENSAVGGLFHCEADRDEAIEIVAEAIRGATHPAGQSAGQGAETGGSVDVIEQCVKLAKDAGLDSVTITGSVRHWQDIIAKLREPAPDSTRTGQAGTDRLARAVEALNGSQLWLDNNHPWRIMLKRGRFNAAVAEAHPESAKGDGEWNDGATICAIVNEAIKLTAALAARPAAPEAQGAWKPIETAPKDGSEIILTDGHTVCSGFWDDAVGCRRADAGWFEECDRAALINAKNLAVTHWMPLPAPPASSCQESAR